MRKRPVRRRHPRGHGVFDIFGAFAFLPDACFVTKKELMVIPFLGWYARKGGMIVVDRDGHASALRKLVAKRAGLLMIAGVNEQPLSLMRRSGFVKHLGEGNLRSSLDDALYIVGAPRETLLDREQL